MQNSNQWLIQATDVTNGGYYTYQNWITNAGYYTYQNWITNAGWPQYNWAQAGVLELYFIVPNCNQLPPDNSIYFSLIDVYEFNPTWDSILNVTNALSWQPTNDNLTPNCSWSPSFISAYGAARLGWVE